MEVYIFIRGYLHVRNNTRDTKVSCFVMLHYWKNHGGEKHETDPKHKQTKELEV